MKASETDGREKSSASVVQLKARLSEYLRRVKAGNEITVTERGLPIARIVPLDDDQRRATREQRLVRAGVLRPGRPGGVRKSLLGGPQSKMTGVLDALLANRDEGER
jgi:prevent-host-death family protein